MRYGFAVKILGKPELKSHDTRRWQSNPHLRVSIQYFREILEYLDFKDIRMYRISSGFAPYVTHPEMPRFHRQIDDCLDELSDVGTEAIRLGIRLSFHPSQYIVLNSTDERTASLAANDLHSQARILDAMNQGPEAVVVTHVGGIYGNRQAGMIRFMRRYVKLSEQARRRLVLENDESNYSVADVLEISRKIGIPVIFDYLHHMNHNPARMGIREAAEAALSTWPAGITPKIHFSSPRTELRQVKRKNPETKKQELVYLPPLITQHSDYINPYEFSMVMEHLNGLRDFDIMIEAKAKDLALLRLRKDLSVMGLQSDITSPD